MPAKSLFATLATIAVTVSAQSGNKYGWADFLTPTSTDLTSTVDWADGCVLELNRECSEESNRGKMYSCLLTNLKEDTVSSGCLDALLARNAKTMRQMEAALAQQTNAESADSMGYSSEYMVPDRPTEVAPVAVPEVKKLDYRVDCEAEIDEYCPKVKNSAIKGELYTCLYNVSNADKAALEDDENYIPKIDGGCYDAMVFRYSQNVAAAGGPAASGLMLETCTTPYRIRSVATPTKCVQYEIGEKVNKRTPDGKMSFAKCDMSNENQHFIVRPYEGGYRFIDTKNRACLDEKMRIRDCGAVTSAFSLTFDDVAQGFVVKNLIGSPLCWGGSKSKPAGMNCPKPTVAGKGKAGKAAKGKAKLGAFLIEPAFGFDLGQPKISG